MEKYIPFKWKAKESWSSNPHIRQIDLKIKMTTRDKEGHYIMMKGYKNKAHIYSVYKKPSSDLKTHID